MCSRGKAERPEQDAPYENKRRAHIWRSNTKEPIHASPSALTNGPLLTRLEKSAAINLSTWDWMVTKFADRVVVAGPDPSGARLWNEDDGLPGDWQTVMLFLRSRLAMSDSWVGASRTAEKDKEPTCYTANWVPCKSSYRWPSLINDASRTLMTVKRKI